MTGFRMSLNLGFFFPICYTYDQVFVTLYFLFPSICAFVLIKKGKMLIFCNRQHGTKTLQEAVHCIEKKICSAYNISLLYHTFSKYSLEIFIENTHHLKQISSPKIN